MSEKTETVVTTSANGNFVVEAPPQKKLKRRYTPKKKAAPRVRKLKAFEKRIRLDENVWNFRDIPNATMFSLESDNVEILFIKISESSYADAQTKEIVGRCYDNFQVYPIYL